MTHHKDTLTGKLADADLLFGNDDGVLAGLKLSGFAIWQQHDRGRGVIVPIALRGDVGDSGALDRLRDAVLEAFARFETGLRPDGPGGYRIPRHET